MPVLVGRRRPDSTTVGRAKRCQPACFLETFPESALNLSACCRHWCQPPFGWSSPPLPAEGRRAAIPLARLEVAKAPLVDQGHLPGATTGRRQSAARAVKKCFSSCCGLLFVRHDALQDRLHDCLVPHARIDHQVIETPAWPILVEVLLDEISPVVVDGLDQSRRLSWCGAASDQPPHLVFVGRIDKDVERIRSIL